MTSSRMRSKIDVAALSRRLCRVGTHLGSSRWAAFMRCMISSTPAWLAGVTCVAAELKSVPKRDLLNAVIE